MSASSSPHQSPLRLSHDRLHSSVNVDSRDSGCYASTETLQQVQEDFRRAVRSYSFDQAQVAAQFMAIRAASISYQDGQLVQSVQELTTEQELSQLNTRETIINGISPQPALSLSVPEALSSSQESMGTNTPQSHHRQRPGNDQIHQVVTEGMSNISPRISPLASPHRTRSPMRSISHDGRYTGYAYPGAPPGYNPSDMDGAIYAATSDLPISPSQKLRHNQMLRSSSLSGSMSPLRGSSPLGSPHMGHRVTHSPLGSPLRMQSPSGSPLRGTSPMGSPLLRSRSPRDSPPRIPSPLSSPQRRVNASHHGQAQAPPIPTRTRPTVPTRTSSLPRGSSMSNPGHFGYTGVVGNLHGTARYVNIEDAEQQISTLTGHGLLNGDITHSTGSLSSVSTGSRTPTTGSRTPTGSHTPPTPSSPLHKSKLPLLSYGQALQQIANNNNNNNPPASPHRTTVQQSTPGLPTKRMSRPLSVTMESLIIAKLEAECIDLTQPPYTDEVIDRFLCFLSVNDTLGVLMLFFYGIPDNIICKTYASNVQVTKMI